MTALWINNPGFYTDHRHCGGMLTKTPPPTELQIPATVTTLKSSNWDKADGVNQEVDYRDKVTRVERSDLWFVMRMM